MYYSKLPYTVFMKRRNQNQKFSFPFFAGSPHTPRRKRIGKEIFGFGSRPKGARGASVIRQNPADFVRNTFELRPIHTAFAKLKRRVRDSKLTASVPQLDFLVRCPPKKSQSGFESVLRFCCTKARPHSPLSRSSSGE